MPKKTTISKTTASKTKTPKTTKDTTPEAKNTQKIEKSTTTKKKAKSPRKTIKKGTIAAINDKIITKSRGEMRFALYLRKSTEEDERQMNSIEDQERICRNFANSQGDINIVAVFKEQQSAAYANERAEFDKMLSMAEDGKIDAIIAYHPDRLSRNMLEAGKILDMLKPTKGETTPILQTLVFPTTAFNNDSGGRLMLAVLFSMATQYSEHLSEQVQRDIDSNLARGISSGTPKWGYQRSELTGLYEPDKNYDLIKKGWEMILAGKSQAEILDYWKAHDVSYMTKTGVGKASKKICMRHKNAVSRLFHDPIYRGILCQKDQEVNLIELEVGFKPMVSEEEYNQVQAMLDGNPQAHRAHKNTNEFTMLRGVVFCSECGSRLQGYLGGHGKDHKIVYYGHRNKTEDSKNCPRQNEITYIDKEIDGKMQKVRVPKEVRANIILDALYEVLDGLKPTKADYKRYLAVANQYANEKTEELRIERQSLSGKLTQLQVNLKRENENYKNLLAAHNAPQITITSTEKQITSLESEIVSTQNKIATIDIKLKKPEQAVMTEKEFLNLLETAADEIKDRNMPGKDVLFRKIFLNAQINKKNEVVFLCKPEFNGLIKHSSVITGGDMWT